MTMSKRQRRKRYAIPPATLPGLARGSGWPAFKGRTGTPMVPDRRMRRA